jgi:hypothetical protein
MILFAILSRNLKIKTYSQSNHRNIRELSLENTEVLVIRSKVMTPLTAAMCLLQFKTKSEIVQSYN